MEKQENIKEGSHKIEFYFNKGERNFRLLIKNNSSGDLIAIDEENTDGYILYITKRGNKKEFNRLMKLADGVFSGIYKFVNEFIKTEIE